MWVQLAAEKVPYFTCRGVLRAWREEVHRKYMQQVHYQVKYKNVP
jgi:hypothetical protein